MKPWENIKKQIADQTRPDLGHVPNLRTHGLVIRNSPTQPDVTPPDIMWRRQIYNLARGDYYVHTPDSYKRYIGYITNQYIGSSQNGGIEEGSLERYTNVHYSVKIFNDSSRQITIPINLSNCSYSLYMREDNEDYVCLNSQIIANPTFVSIPLRGGIWTELHLFVYFGRQEGLVSAFRNLANYIQSWREPDISAPTAPTWYTPALTTSQLDPGIGNSVVELHWLVPTEQDWAGNGIYRVEVTQNPSMDIALPSGYFTPKQLTDIDNLHVITITGNAKDKFPHGALVTATGTGSADYTVFDTEYYAANLVPNNNFATTNVSGYPTDWVAVVDAGCTIIVSSGGNYGYNQVSGYAPTGATHDCHVTNSGFIPISPGEEYVLSFSSLILGATADVECDVLFYDTDTLPCSSGYAKLTVSGTGSGWQEYVFDGGAETASGCYFNIPGDCEYIKLRLHLGQKSSTVSYPDAYADVRWAHETVHAGYSPITFNHTMITISGNDSAPINTSGYNLHQYQDIHIADRARQSSDMQKDFILFEDFGVSYGSVYKYKLDTYDYAHNRSNFSTEQTITAGDIIPPAQVTQATGIPGYETVLLEWVNPSDSDFYAVKIYITANPTPISPELVMTKTGAADSHDWVTVGNITPYVDYTFQLTTIDVNNNENLTAPPTVTLQAHRGATVNQSGLITSTGNDFSIDVDRGVISAMDQYGNYSHMSDGELRYYQSSGQQIFSYPKGICIIPATNLVCGQENYFSALGLIDFATPPQAILIPARMMTFNTAADFGSGIRQYIDLEVVHTTVSSIFPRAYIFAGATATPQTYTALSDMTIWSDGLLSYDADATAENKEGDAFIGCSGSWTSHKITVNYKFAAPTHLTEKYPHGEPGEIILRLWSDIGTSTWAGDATNNVNQKVSYYANGKTYYGSITIDNPTLDTYNIKMDYYDRSLPAYAPSEIELLSVQYINNGSAAYELTGSGICGALLII